MAEDLDIQLVISAQNKAKAIIDDLTRSVGGMGKGFSVAGAAGVAAGAAIATTAVGVAAVGAGLALVTASGIKSAMTLEQNKVAFTTMLGSAEKASAVLKDITTFAATTPFELPEVQNSARSLLAFGIEAEKLEPTLRSIGDVASGVGAPIGELSELYGKAHTQGRLFAEDINQLTGRGIPIIQELAEQFGVTTDKVKELVENGDVGFEQLETAFQSMSGEGGQFYNLMEEQSKTAGGAISNLKDTFTQLSMAIVGVDPEGNITEGGIFDRFKNILGVVLTFLNSNKDAIVNLANILGDHLSKALGVVVIIMGILWGKLQIAYKQWQNHEGIIGKVRTAMENTWKTIQNGIQQWNNYEGTMGTIRTVLETVGNFLTNQFKKAWDDLMIAIKPHLPELKLIAKILVGALLVAIGLVVVGIAGLIIVSIKLVAAFSQVRDYIAGKIMGAFHMMKSGAHMMWNALVSAKDYMLQAITNIRVGFAEMKLNIFQTIANIKQYFQDLKDDITTKLGGLKDDAVAWGQHMIDNFKQGVLNAIPGLDGAVNTAKRILERMKFSRNKEIPSEVWGEHMMDNFAEGMGKGSEEVQARIDEIQGTLDTWARERLGSTAKESTARKQEIFDLRKEQKDLKEQLKMIDGSYDDYLDKIEEVEKKTKKSWEQFDKASKAARKEYRVTITEINEKNNELKNSFKETFSSAVLDVRENMAKMKSEINDSNLSFDQKMAVELVDAEDVIKETKQKIADEMSAENPNEEKVSELQSSLAEQEKFLQKHAGIASKLGRMMTEERRVRSLDEIELLLEQKAKEGSILQAQIDQEKIMLDTHAQKIKEFNGAIVEQRRIRGLDEIALLVENFEVEKSALQLQEDEALEAKKEALKKAKKAYKKHLKGLVGDTKSAVKEMTAEFGRIPATMAGALESLSSRLINAGNKIGEKTVNNTKNDNSKKFDITINAESGDGQKDLLKRLNLMLKTL